MIGRFDELIHFGNRKKRVLRNYSSAALQDCPGGRWQA